MPDAVALGKRYIVAAVAHSYPLGAATWFAGSIQASNG
jgi:hypothetical protein